MAKPEWGTKRLCHSCGARFYDMGRHPIICPKCSTTLDPEVLMKKRRGRPPASETKMISFPPALEEELDLDEGLESLGETDDVLEDTSDFGEDEEVVSIGPASDEE